MEKFSPYIGGKLKATKQTFSVKNPFSDETIAEVYLAGSAELEEAIISAQRIEDELRYLPSHKKCSILMDIAQKMKEQRDLLARTLCLEAAKPIKYALGEVDRAIQTFIVAAEECKRLPSEHIQIDWTPAGEGKEGIVKYFPIGLVAGVSPFNFPLNLTVHKLAPAIATGCPIVLKPARSTPLSALLLAKIIDTTELPKGALSILPMDRESGNQLVTDERFALLTFTGSPQVGWNMKNQAGKKRVVLELGGNAGAIVTDTADIEKTALKCVSGAFAYSGQVCIHTQRIYVHKSIFNEFTTRFIELTSKLKHGNPIDATTDISSMIDEDNAIRIEQWVKEAIDGGAKLLYGGNREGAYYPPAIITNTKQDMKVCSQEAFGPVVVIEPYNNFSDAVGLINSSEFGLQAGVFTNKLDEQNQAFNELKVGGVIINDVPTFRVDHMPYGGVKNSGFGREGVKYAMLDMLEPKLLIRNYL
ncbi:MAG: aldehyde dehydrogenase family protein [Bacteroidales bacterium]|nr:MAG: aldehyde dehydrogenase family protein [Bacteroidales bacterium]